MNPETQNQTCQTNQVFCWSNECLIRCGLLAIAALLSLPPWFSSPPNMGLDPSWQLSLQLATLNDKVFGQEFVFTYGPLGYLFFHVAFNKGVLLLYDAFILGSLLRIYHVFLPAKPGLFAASVLIALASVTKICLTIGAPAVLFTLLCYWLWRLYEQGDGLSMAGSLAAAFVLFFAKVNYGLVMMLMVPLFALGLLLLQPQRRIQGALLLTGFAGLVGLGSIALHVALPVYLRSAVELISGYNEAMFSPPQQRVSFGLACVFLLAVAVVAFMGRNRLSWRAQAMILPNLCLAILLLFKNGFVRPDGGHSPSFFAALPLLFAVWWLTWRKPMTLYLLLLASLPYPLARLASQNRHISSEQMVQILPLRYFSQAVQLPWRQNLKFLQDQLSAKYPDDQLPRALGSAIGHSSVDVMPWESSIAILNKLNYEPRPVPQSYSAYTLWLDNLNADYVSSAKGPEYVFYACAQNLTIDSRPSAWDESRTKMSLLEHYAYASECQLPMKTYAEGELKPATVFLLKRTALSRRFVPIGTESLRLALNQNFPLPPTTNLLFLTLDAHRSILGKVRAAALSPSLLTITFNYVDGTSTNYRAILPILKTGVLVNRRVESTGEVRNWLKGEAAANAGVASIRLDSSSPWAFSPPFEGTLTEYRLVEK